MKKYIRFIFILLIIIIAGVFYLNTKGRMIPVKQIFAEERRIKRTVSSSGVIRSDNEAQLSFASLGRIYRIYCHEGNPVKKGMLLATLDSYSESETAKVYKDARDVALRDRDLFIEQYETNKDAVSGADEYSIQLRRLDELVSKAEASYQAQLGLLTRNYIYAPFDGYVIKINKKEGETALAGESILYIADLDNLFFEIALDQEDYGYLHINQPVEITLDAYENEQFTGEIINLPNYINLGETTNFIVKIGLSELNDKSILLGMGGDASIILSDSVSKVPSLVFDEILYDIEDKPFLFVSENGIVKKLLIELGIQGDIYTQILTPVELPIIQSISDKLILEENLKVRIIN